MRLAVMMVVGILTLATVGCYRPDPRVQAANDFRDTVFSLISEDEAQTKRLNSLRLGMSSDEVMKSAGAPTERKTDSTAERTSEIWTYNGQLTTLGTLTLENGKLTNVQTY